MVDVLSQAPRGWLGTWRDAQLDRDVLYGGNLRRGGREDGRETGEHAARHVLASARLGWGRAPAVCVVREFASKNGGSLLLSLRGAILASESSYMHPRPSR